LLVPHDNVSGAKLPNIIILLPVEETKLLSPEGEKIIILAER